MVKYVRVYVCMYVWLKVQQLATWDDDDDDDEARRQVM